MNLPRSYRYDLGAGSVAGAASAGFGSGNAAAGAALDLSSDLSVCAVEKLLKDMKYPFHNSNNDLPLVIIWWIYKYFSMGVLITNYTSLF